ncbi:hypothetical protein [Nocardia carnea]|uniref:hypothetical protein n=1 Tax=Nocardia carnea TaxID=37328 RepID=UPI002457F275|nr:hypothetical protein [Nocardia carnea]
MNDTSGPASDRDAALAERLATLMRVGTASTTGLLIVGVVFRAAGAYQPSTIALVAGCGLLVLLPLLRLVVMLGDFARQADRQFVVWTAVVIGLVIAGGAMGVYL